MLDKGGISLLAAAAGLTYALVTAVWITFSSRSFTEDTNIQTRKEK